MSSVYTFEQISAPRSSSTSTSSNLKADESVTNNVSSRQSSTTSTRKRKRRNSTMIIKPARWSPPMHHHHTSNALLASAPIESDFQPTFYNPNEIKHRRRISSQQYGILEDEYQINTKPNASKRHHLAELLGMTPRTVQIWFQNKRAKTKNQQGKPVRAAKKSPTGTAKATAKQSPSSYSSLSPAVTGHVDQFTFDDGRLDPIYLMDDYDMKAFMAASTSPSLSSTTSTGNSTRYSRNHLSSNDDDDSNNNNKNVTAVVTRKDGNPGEQQSSMMDDHGTTATAPSICSASSSPLLPSLDTDDSFAMEPHHSMSTNQLQRQDQCCDETPLFAPTALSSPCQPFSPLAFHDLQHKDTGYSTMSISSPSTTKVPDPDQEQQLRYDALYILNWMEKTPVDFAIGGSMVPSWPYVMDQLDLQTNCFDFDLSHDDWVDPFSVSA